MQAYHKGTWTQVVNPRALRGLAGESKRPTLSTRPPLDMNITEIMARVKVMRGSFLKLKVKSVRSRVEKCSALRELVDGATLYVEADLDIQKQGTQ